MLVAMEEPVPDSDPVTLLEAILLRIEERAQSREHRLSYETMLLKHAGAYAELRRKDPDQADAARARVMRACGGEFVRELERRAANGEDSSPASFKPRRPLIKLRDAQPGLESSYFIKG